MVKKKAAKKKRSPPPPKVRNEVARESLATLRQSEPYDVLMHRLDGITLAITHLSHRISDLEDAAHEDRPHVISSESEWIPSAALKPFYGVCATHKGFHSFDDGYCLNFVCRDDPDAAEAEKTEWVPCDEADRTETEKK